MNARGRIDGGSWTVKARQERNRVIVVATPFTGPPVTVSFDLDVARKEAPCFADARGGAPNIAESTLCSLLVRYDKDSSTVRIDSPEPDHAALWIEVQVPRRSQKRARETDEEPMVPEHVFVAYEAFRQAGTENALMYFVHNPDHKRWCPWIMAKGNYAKAKAAYCSKEVTA